MMRKLPLFLLSASLVWVMTNFLGTANFSGTRAQDSKGIESTADKSSLTKNGPTGFAPLNVLMLGDRGHHLPLARASQLIPVLAERGIHITYTEKLTDLNKATLNKYDCLIVYANTTRIGPAEEKALLNYVAEGGGLVPLHCASYCFLNSQKYIDLVGGQFLRHGTGIFRTQIEKPKHPTMVDLPEFETWDETYVHTKRNTKNRIVLQTRLERDGSHEPWTWVRTHGRGRVFYTAYGHDQRTWGHPGFHTLVERGIRWAAGDDRVVPHRQRPQKGLKPFEYTEAKLPNYLAGKNWGTQGEPIGRMQVPLSPEESMKHMILPVGFEAKLFAAEPDIKKPICMTWDERGRLWIAETVDYPNNIQVPGKGHDRIKICEDTDGDGRADKFTVFAEKLSIPTSLVIHHGGVIVHQAPDTLFLKDTDGDGKADVRKVLFTGWSTGDTHAGPSNMRLGHDNWIWGIVGYSGFRGTIGGEQHNFRSGFYRFKPDGSKFEFVRNTNNNSWGVGQSEEGLIFGSTANRNPSVYMPIANRYYESVRGWSSSVLGTIAESSRFYPITENVRQVDQHGHFTAGAGHALYTARRYPKSYWNRTAFVAGPTGHLLSTFVLQKKGSDFVSRNSWNLLASDDQWSAPISAEVGPDGFVWMIDWYNYIVQHNPTPRGFKTGKGNAYATKLRDKRHGRIYRIVYKNAPKQKPMTLAGASPEKLVATLKHSNMFWRMTAQRLLVQRNKQDVVQALVKLVGDPSVDHIGLNVGAIHALWTLHGLGLIQEKQHAIVDKINVALQHSSPGVRRAALMVMPRNESSVAMIIKLRLLADPDAQVRLAAFLAMAEMPPSRDAGREIARQIVNPANYQDRWIRDAATSAAARHDLGFLLAMAAPRKKLNAAASSGIRPIIGRVAEHFARGGPSETVGDVLRSLVKADPNFAAGVIDGLSAGWPQDKKPILNDGAQQAMATLIARLPGATKGRCVKLASQWNVQGVEKYTAKIVADLLKRVVAEEASDQQRIDAAGQLIAFRASDKAVVRQVLDIVSARSSPELASGVIRALLESEAANVGSELVARYNRLTPSARRTALQVMLRRATATTALLDGVEAGKIPVGDLLLDQKQALAKHPDSKIALRAKQLLSKGGGLPNADREKVLRDLISIVKEQGDAAQGKLVFTQQCAKCHRHGGEGKDIGPDLSGMAAHTKEELLTNIIDPSRSVEGNFRIYSVVTTDGETLSGLLASENKTAIELIDVEGKKHILLREDIEQLVGSKKSLMPEGFEKQVSRQSIVDLLTFLTQRGKYLPLPLAKVATIVSTRGMFISKNATVERLIFPDWKPKTFQGVPFQLVNPRGDRVANVVMLHGPNGNFPPKMPKQVSLPCNSKAKAIHFLSGVGGWAAQGPIENGTVSMIVRLHYADGKQEDHLLRNGQHFADYIGHFEVPKSKLAFKLRGQQIRYLAVYPKRSETIREIELIKGRDRTAPIVMAITVETAK